MVAQQRESVHELTRTAAHTMRVLTDIVIVNNETDWTPAFNGYMPCVLPCAPGQHQHQHQRQGGTGGQRQGGTGVVFPALYGEQRVAVKVPFVQEYVDKRTDASSTAPVGQFFCNELRINERLLMRMPSAGQHDVAMPIGVCVVSWDDKLRAPYARRDDQPCRPALVFRWEGPTLAGDIEVPLASPRWLHPDDVAKLFARMGRSIARAHDANIVHYDVKLSNFIVMATRESGGPMCPVRSCKLIDFSHSKLADPNCIDAQQQHRPHLHRPNYPMLTEATPWATTILAATPWLDVYALGGVFIEVLDKLRGYKQEATHDATLRDIAAQMRLRLRLIGDTMHSKLTAHEVVAMLDAI